MRCVGRTVRERMQRRPLPGRCIVDALLLMAPTVPHITAPSHLSTRYLTQPPSATHTDTARPPT